MANKMIELFKTIMASESIVELDRIKNDCMTIENLWSRRIAVKLCEKRINDIAVDNKIKEDGFDTVLNALLQDTGLRNK